MVSSLEIAYIRPEEMRIACTGADTFRHFENNRPWGWSQQTSGI